MSGVWISRMLKNNLMEDVFNTANRASCRRHGSWRMSIPINLPTKFVYQAGNGTGWINIINPSRATIVRNARFGQELTR